MKHFAVLILLCLMVSTVFSQTLPVYHVYMNDSVYAYFLSRDIFDDERLVTDSVVYTRPLLAPIVRYDAKIRYKGNSTRYFPKKGHQVKFDNDFPSPTMPGKTFRTLTLNPMFTDKSFVREAFVWASLHDLGTMAPQTTYGQFHINRDYKGLYLQVDKVDKYLIKAWGRNNKCQMFEAEDYYCQGTLDIVSDSLLRVYYLPELDPTDLQYQRLKNMILQLNTVTDEGFVEWFDATFDTKSVMDWFAINILSTSGDTYNKNYFIYNDTTRATQQWTIIPWDYDLSMGRNGDATIGYPWGLLNDLFIYTYDPLAGPHNVLKDRFKNSPVLMARFRSYLDSLFSTVWTEQRLQNRIDSLANLVRDYVRLETVPQGYGLPESFEEQITALKYYITVRRNRVIHEFIHPIGGDYHMATLRGPFEMNQWYHGISIDGRQVASVKVKHIGTQLDSLFVRVRPDSTPVYLTTGRGHIRRWLEVKAYPANAYFTATIQWSWNEYNQRDSEVRTQTNERHLSMYWYAPAGQRVGYVPLRESYVNAYGNYGQADIDGGEDGGVTGAGKHLAFLEPDVTSVEPTSAPQVFALHQNYPNPFNPSTQIKIDLPARSSVQLIVYDLMGREVAQLVDDNLEAGSHSVNFNAAQLSSGTYFYRLVTDTFTSTKKMILVR